MTEHRFSQSALTRLVDGRANYNLSESYGEILDWETLRQWGVDEDLSGLALNYGTTRGAEDLRRAISLTYGADPGQVLVTAGASSALFLAIFTTAGRGDEVITTAPNFSPIFAAITAADARSRLLPLSFADGYAFPLQALSDACSERTALVILTSPGMPSGRFIPDNDLAAAIDIVRARAPRARLIVDEAYRRAGHGEDIRPSAFHDHDVTVIDSLSKCHGAPGLRIGWIVSRDAHLLDRVTAAKFGTSIATSVANERLAVAIFRNEADILRRLRGRLVTNYAITRDWAERVGADWLTPDGGGYCALRVRDAFGSVAIDAIEAAGIQLARDEWFGGASDIVRFGFAHEPAHRLADALEIVGEILRKRAVPRN